MNDRYNEEEDHKSQVDLRENMRNYVGHRVFKHNNNTLNDLYEAPGTLTNKK